MKTPQTLPDQQNLTDHRQIKIDQVGVKGLRYPIQVKDKAHAVQNTIAILSMTVDLPHHFKGTHMSRFVEVLNAHGSLVHVENITTILHELQTKLQAEAAHLTMEFPYFIEKSAPVSGSKGLVDYQAKFEASAYQKKIDFILT
ncbi:MAG: GTP cyclohydrolase, FolE2/MptA family, partial [Verrucomicrobiota bacterium]